LWSAVATFQARSAATRAQQAIEKRLGEIGVGPIFVKFAGLEWPLVRIGKNPPEVGFVLNPKTDLREAGAEDKKTHLGYKHLVPHRRRLHGIAVAAAAADRAGWEVLVRDVDAMLDMIIRVHAEQTAAGQVADWAVIDEEVRV